MAAVVANTNILQVLDDASQSTSQTPSPTSPAPSLQIQQSQLPRFVATNVTGGTGPTVVGGATSPVVSLEPPAGSTYPEFLRTWSDTHVARWLTDIKCGHHAAMFKMNDIRGDVLLELDQVTLKEMGLNSVGDRLRIFNAVKALRQKCSSSTNSALTSLMNRPRAVDHTRNPSLNGELNGGARGTVRRLESGRPAPLHLTPPNGSPELPRLVRDGQDSARTNGAIRPLPHPTSASSHGTTPTTAHSVRANLPPLPPPPRGQPPLPPTRTPRSLHPPSSALSGRRTPTSSEAPPLSAQSIAQNLLTPTAQGQSGSWSSYGLPSDPRQGVRTPNRSTSPLSWSNPPTRNMARSPNEIVPHARTSSIGAAATGSPAGKLPIRPTPNSTPHPYASPQGPQNNLSPIAESFASQRTTASTPSPPTSVPFRVGTGPFRSATPQHNPSLDDLRRKLVKFSLPEEGKSTTINVADCAGGIEVLERALKKFGKLSARPEGDPMLHVEKDDGRLSVDGWGVYLDYGQDDAMNTPLTEGQLLSICHAPPDDPAREYGLTLRPIGRSKRSGTHSPISPVFAVPDVDDINDLLPSDPPLPTPPTATPKATKRASSISVLSGLGVPIPEKYEGSSSNVHNQSPTKSPTKKGPSKLRNFFGQRPPSELITNHLADYFPAVEKKVLERTRRQSMLRAPGVSPNGRDSVISWTQPSRSRFSVSTMGSGKTTSPRASMSSASITIPDSERNLASTSGSDTQSLAEPPRVSLSTDDGRSIDLREEDPVQDTTVRSRGSKRSSSLHLLPPVAFPSESLSDSFNFEDGEKANSSRPLSRTASNASRRTSLITELRSKVDRSDTVSLMTVDEITAEVESRRENDSQETDVESTDSWTKVDVSDDDEKQSIMEQSEESDEDDDSDAEDEENEDVPDDATVSADDVDDDDETGKAITSHGRERTIKWIKGALIGAGSFGKVYLGMDASTGLLMAVKQVELPTGSAPNEERKKSMLSALEHEIELLKDLHHENIVQYHSSCLDGEYLNIFLEYVPGGSVTSVLRNYGAFEEPLVRNWVRQILLGLNYLHERDIIHRDIKGANMLVDNKGGIKISDFGISKKVEDNLMPGTRAHRPSLQGSVFWMAPEVVKQTAYTQKADIWSVGCLVVEMLTGEHPWAQLTQMQAIFKIGSSAKPAIPADISPEADSFLQLTFELNHEARPSAAELLKHPWIANQPLPLAPGQ